MSDFSNHQRKALKNLFSRQPVYPATKGPEIFLLKYIFFESICRVIGRFYRQRATSKKSIKASSFEHLQINLVERSFTHFGIRVRPETLFTLLDSSADRRSSKSARNLRNGLVHRWDENDCSEVQQRFRELTMAMDSTTNIVEKRLLGN